MDERQLSLLAGAPADDPAGFDPARLTQARQARGWTKRRLAELVDVSATAVGHFEAGVTRPRPALLAALAGALEVDPAFFLPGRPRAAVDAATTHFRSLRSMRVSERDRAVTFAAQVWELAHALQRHVSLPALDLPEPHPPAPDLPEPDLPEPAPDAPDPDATGATGLARAAAAARAVRRDWRLGDGPVAHLVRLLEAHGVLVALLPFGDAGRVDAFSTSATPRPVVVLTGERNVYRHRFTAAHELGHLLLHADAAPGDPGHEREANAFAAELLLPARRLLHELPARLDLPRLLALQQTWGVSVEALLYRGRELGVYSEATHRRGRVKVHELAHRGLLTPPPLGEHPGERPLLLRRAYETAAGHAGTTLQDLAAELAWTPRAVADLLGLAAEDAPHLRLV